MKDPSPCPLAGSGEAVAQADRPEDDQQPAEPGSTFTALPWWGLHYE